MHDAVIRKEILKLKAPGPEATKDRGDTGGGLRDGARKAQGPAQIVTRATLNARYSYSGSVRSSASSRPAARSATKGIFMRFIT
jgi:hypothetical protein